MEVKVWEENVDPQASSKTSPRRLQAGQEGQTRLRVCGAISLRPQGKDGEGSGPLPPGAAQPGGEVRDKKRLHVLQY